MSTDFADIKITGLNDRESQRRGPGSAIVQIVLDLSASAPYEWADYFNQRWRQHFYMMKRQAHVSGARLEIECVPEELQNDHLPELKKVIAETNQAYAKYHAAKQRALDEESRVRRPTQRSSLLAHVGRHEQYQPEFVTHACHGIPI